MFGRLLKFLFPSRCRGCGARDIALCSTCLKHIRMASELEDSHTYAVFDYGNKIIRSSIRELKYHRRSATVEILTKASAPYIAEYVADSLHSLKSEMLIFIPIPEHKSKQRDRGFNQSALIANWLASEMPNTQVKALLKKIVATTPQAHLNRTQRLKNTAGTMQAVKNLDPKAVYIIIDDVTTTGATFVEARRALRAGGAKKILCIALAHGYARK